MERNAQALILIGLTVSTIVTSVFIFADTHGSEAENRIIKGKINEVKLLASRTELRLNDAASISSVIIDIKCIRDSGTQSGIPVSDRHYISQRNCVENCVCQGC